MAEISPVSKAHLEDRSLKVCFQSAMLLEDRSASVDQGKAISLPGKEVQLAKRCRLTKGRSSVYFTTTSRNYCIQEEWMARW